MRILTRKPISLFSAHVIQEAVLEVNGKLKHDNIRAGGKKRDIFLLGNSDKQGSND
jgi:hypothetical protein